MKYVSSTQAGLLLSGLVLIPLVLVGCVKDLGLGSSGPEEGSSGTGVSTGAGGATMTGGVSGTTGAGGATMTSGGMATGAGGATMTSGTFGVGGGGMETGSSGTTGVGGGGMETGSSGTTGVGGGGMETGSTGAGGSSMTSGTSGAGGSSPVGCGLGGEPVACDFSHLNADCAPYGAVCDFLFAQCSCCFLHDELTCSSDADCQSSFGAGAFCSAGTCGCK